VRATITLVILAALPSSAGPATLKDFLAAADAQNVDQRISLEQREKAVAEYRQAWTAMLPSLTVQGTWTRNQKEVSLDMAGALTPALGPLYEALHVAPPSSESKPTVITPLNQLDATLRVDLPLIDTTRWMRAVAANEVQLGASEKARITRDLVRRQVIAAYYGYAAALAMRASAAKALNAAEAQLKLTTVRASAGTVTELDVLRSRAEVARNKQTVVDANTLAVTTRRTLRTLSGVEPPETVPLPQANLSPEPGFEELERGVGELPAVRSAEHDAEAAGSMSTMQKLALVPTIGAQFSERITNATGFAGQNAFWNAGVTATWRLDATTITGIEAQARGQNIATLALERVRLNAADQIHNDWQRFTAALRKIDAVEAQVAAAALAAQVARDRYAAGAAAQIEVITAERDLSNAEFNQIQALTDLATARLSLRLSAGRPLDGEG
jgi:outer membrane protein TolC